VPGTSGRRSALPNARRTGQSPQGEKRRGTGRTVRGRETRRKLVEAAKEVFERDGFVHARIADICGTAGISHGSFYTYFLTKEEVFAEVADSIEEDLFTLEPAPADAGPIERVRLANEHYLRVYAANSKLLQVVDQVASIDPKVRETSLERHDAFSRAIERRIRQLQESGDADPGVRPEYAALALGSMVTSFASYLFNSGRADGFAPDTAAEQLTRLWVNALGMRYPATDGASAGP
jgi:AcrR family transcriptional regulator